MHAVGFRVCAAGTRLRDLQGPRHVAQLLSVLCGMPLAPDAAESSDANASPAPTELLAAHGTGTAAQSAVDNIALGGAAGAMGLEAGAPASTRSLSPAPDLPDAVPQHAFTDAQLWRCAATCFACGSALARSMRQRLVDVPRGVPHAHTR